ncbi:RNA polymerase sigma factor [Actinoplanes hulinensis]|uniref:RNA polymerase sigma factor n=1 Tax=Actinoplanes hulinensis TaxID=1144547 RepID=A0ABS7BE89_9ACTN|nr:RNA polymerase sigma factor [Actinoplanes hulinensis]MBW6439195.1 RNA polymerase sigma factor [Actinoplanes hulinensis]
MYTDPAAARRVLEAVWRIESARLVASLARLVGDVGLAEELAQDTLVIALEQWPRDGIPADPGPWLRATAKHRAIDAVRRRQRYAEKLAVLGTDAVLQQRDSEDELLDRLDDHIGDDLLRLIFTAAHPVLSSEARVALTLRLLGGLSTTEIARAFLIPEATAAQRIVRAKRTLAAAGVRFTMPTPAETMDRVNTVLSVVYLIFNEGYAATSGADWTQPALCREAMRLGRVLAGLLPDEPEVHGLVALMELQASRLPARTDQEGRPVLLEDQDRRRWDRLLIRRGLAALERAESLGGGPYTVQAAIAACHARSHTAADTDWKRIAALYEVLAYLQPSPVVRLNQAVAVSKAGDPMRGLMIVEALGAERALRGYPHLPAVRGELLAQVGRIAEAQVEFQRAAELTRNEGERTLFRARRESLASDQGHGTLKSPWPWSKNQ